MAPEVEEFFFGCLPKSLTCMCRLITEKSIVEVSVVVDAALIFSVIKDACY